MSKKRFWTQVALLIVVIITVWGPYIYSLDYRQIKVRNLSIKDGLSQTAVICILQDRRGFMWFGTQDGLNRYDGYTFQVFRNDLDNPASMDFNFVTALYEDKEGKIWIGGILSTISVYDPETGLFKNFLYDSQKNASKWKGAVTAINETSSGQIVISTQGSGLFYLNRKTGQFTRPEFMSSTQWPSYADLIACLYADEAGDFWLGTRQGILHVNPGTGKITPYLSELVDTGTGTEKVPILIRSICKDKDGKSLWACARSGIIHFDPATGNREYYQDVPRLDNKKNARMELESYDHESILRKNISLSNRGLNTNEWNSMRLINDNFVSIFKDRNGIIWAGTFNNGLFRYIPEVDGFIKYTVNQGTPTGLSNNSVVSIYEDRGGVMWFGTYGAGVDKYVPRTAAFVHYYHDPNDSNSPISSDTTGILNDSRGLWWIGTRNGLNMYNPDTGQYKHFLAAPGSYYGLSSNEVGAIIEDNNGYIWIGTNDGLNRYNRQSGKFLQFFHDPQNPDGLSDDFISVIAPSRYYPGTLWVGTTRNGLNEFNTITLKSRRLLSDPNDPGSLSENKVFCLLQDRMGTMWVGTSKGLNKYNVASRTFKRYLYDPKKNGSLIGNSILTLYEDNRNILWIGTLDRGLNRMDPKNETFQNYNIKHGLSNNTIYCILEDDFGYLWLSTNDGLNKFDPITGAVTVFDETEGIQSNEFNDTACYKYNDGRLFFGGINGFNAFFPNEIGRNRHIPLIAITRFQKYNRDVQLNQSIIAMKELELSYKDDMISFEFTALDYSAPNKNLYAYKLEGFDKNWIPTTSDKRFAVYTNLPSGNYTFRVKASNNQGLWNETGTSLKIIIPPPFWQTLWFRLLLGIVLLIAIFIVYRFRLRSINNQKEKLAELVRQRTEDLEKKKDEVENARKAAEKANYSKGDFLARMSHEIRTPMNSVIGFTELLLDTQLSEEQLDYVRTINQSGESLLNLVNDILDFSKIESGQLSLEAIDFDIEAMAFDVCELMRPRIGSRPVEILCRMSEKVPGTVKSDPGRYRQVLINLVNNAVKFTRAGEIQLSIDVDSETNDTITLHARVTDTGIGIPQDKLQTIFECFQQADESTTRKYGGSGLGLSICKQMASLMGGDVWAESVLGKGSTFHFTAVMAKSGQKRIRRAASQALAGKKILVVDDNKNNLDILTQLLTSAGIEVVTLTRGQDVLPILFIANKTRSPFDLCILDIHLPDISGYDVARSIRGNGSPNPSLPILAFASHYSKLTKLFQTAGFDDFLPKPIQGSRLIEMLENILLTTPKNGNRKQEDTTPHPGNPIPTSVFHVTSVSEPTVSEEKRNTRILLAEDNPINQKLATFLLKKAGYTVEVVNNGKEAVEKFINDPSGFDMIFMDVQMPEMDGKEASKWIREKGFTAIPIIAMTAQAMKGDREKCLNAGMNDYIAKPIKREAIFAMVQKWAGIKASGAPIQDITLTK